MANIGHLQATIGMDTKRLAADTARARGIITRFAGGAVRSFGGVGGAFAGIASGVAVGMLIKSVVGVGAAFEQSLTTAGAVMRATGEEIEALEMRARKLGETTEWSATQAADALQFLGMAGFNAAESMAALPGVLDLATAGQIQLARGADIATNALTAMGLPVEELNRVNDVFVGTITRSNTNMEMLADTFRYAAPLARAYGYSIEELSGLIGILGNAGIQGSMAGTQLAMAMQKANDAAADLNLESSDLLDVLQALRDRNASNAEVMSIFGQRAGRAALVLKEMIPEARELQETLGGVEGEAKTLADTMRKTVQGAFKELQSIINEVGIASFKEFREELMHMTRGIIGWFREHKDEIVSFIKTIVKVTGGLLTILGTLINALWEAGAEFVKFFDTIEDQAEQTAVSFEQSMRDMERSMEPPDVTPWMDLWTWMGQVGRNFLQIMALVGKVIAIVVIKQLGTLVAAIDNIFNSLMLLQEAASALLRWDFSGAKEAMGNFSTEWSAFVDDMQMRAQDINAAYKDVWHDFIYGVDIRSIGEIHAEEYRKGLEGKAVDVRQAQEKLIAGLVPDPKDLFTIPTRGLSAPLEEHVLAYKKMYQVNRVAKTALEHIWQTYEDERVADLKAGVKERAAQIWLEGELAQDMLNAQRIAANEAQAAITALGEERAKFLTRAGVHTAKDVAGIGGGEFEGLQDNLGQVTSMYEEIARDTTQSIYDQRQAWTWFFFFKRQAIEKDTEKHKASLQAQGRSAEEAALQSQKWAESQFRMLDEQRRALSMPGGSLWEQAWAMGPAPPESPAKAFSDEQVRAYRQLLSSTTATRDELERIWQGYERVRKAQIMDQYLAFKARLRQEGLDTQVATEQMEEAYRSLAQEQKDIFREQASWLEQWGAEIARGLQWTFQRYFFDVIKGEWTSLTNFLSSIWDLFLQDISRRAATRMSDLFLDLVGVIAGAITGARGAPSYTTPEGGVPIGRGYAMQHGGIVLTPTTALIGERGPEAVIPLPHLRNPEFLDSLRADTGARGGVQFTMIVQTPDLGSFKKSRTQIGSSMAMMLREAQRRNG